MPPVFNLTGCYAPAMPNFFGACQFSVIVVEAILCICMLYKAWIIYKSEFGSPFLKLLIYDRLVTDSFVRGSVAPLTFGQRTLLFQVNNHIIGIPCAVMTARSHLQHACYPSCDLFDFLLGPSRSYTCCLWVGHL